MNGEDLLKAMSQVDERYIQEAESAVLSKSKIPWVRWTAVAAACLVVVLSAGLLKEWNFALKTEKDSAVMEDARFPAGESGNEMMEAPNELVQPEATVPAMDNDHSFHRNPPGAAAEPETEPVSDQEPAEPKEIASMLVRIDTWQEDGFEATVEGIVDTDIYPLGTKLMVRFQKNIRIVETDGEVVSCTLRKPTKEDFPAGSVVQILFAVEGDGALLAEQIGKEEAF